MTSGLIAVLRIRGVQGSRFSVKQTMSALHLTRQHHLVLKKDSPTLQSMLRACKDYVAWGPADEKTVAALKAKFKEQDVYRLNSPKKGFGSSVKASGKNGTVGNVGAKINSFIEKMM